MKLKFKRKILKEKNQIQKKKKKKRIKRKKKKILFKGKTLISDDEKNYQMIDFLKTQKKNIIYYTN